MDKPKTIYKVFLKNGQTVTLKGRRSIRDSTNNTFEIYDDERKKSLCARFELSEVAGVTFEEDLSDRSELI